MGLLNVDGFYNSLLSFIDKAVDEGFISPTARRIIVSAPTTKQLVIALEVNIAALLNVIWLNISKNAKKWLLRRLNKAFTPCGLVTRKGHGSCLVHLHWTLSKSQRVQCTENKLGSNAIIFQGLSLISAFKSNIYKPFWLLYFYFSHQHFNAHKISYSLSFECWIIHKNDIKG